MRQRIFENWEFNDYEFLPSHTAEVELIESNGKKLKEGVLGIVRGPSFFGDSFSRNGRFYPKELWENALKNPEFQRNLKRGLIFSCIGHPENYSLDELLASGATAARVKDVNFDGKTGIVTYEILDTPAGRILNTILRSGSKPYVSTRGFGSFLNETKEWNGRKVPILNPNDYYLESIDFVINPGFLETDPQLVESLKEDLQKLQESNIKCIDGICNIEKKSENKLMHLSKEELIDIIENLKKENEYLLEEKSKEKKDFKHEKLFFAYLEILLQLLKYNVEYKDTYERLSQYIDSDSLDNKELQDIKDACENILKNEFDESIKEIAENIIKIIDINLGKQADENVKEGIVNYVYRYWDLMQQINNEKSKVQKLQKENKIIQKTIEKLIETNEKLLNENYKLNKQYKQLQERYKNEINELQDIIFTLKEEKLQIEKDYNIIKENLNIIKKQLNEKINKLIKENNELKAYDDSLLEKLELYKEKYKTLKDNINKLKEELIEKEKIIEKLNNNIESLTIKNQMLENDINELRKNNKINEDINKKINVLNETVKNLRNKLKEELSEKEQLRNEISTFNETINSLNEEIKNLKTELNNQKIENNKLKEEKDNLLSKNEKLLIKYLQEKYRLDELTIETICKKFNFELSLIEKELNSIKEKVVDSKYIAFDVKEEKQPKKQTMLERLIN